VFFKFSSISSKASYGGQHICYAVMCTTGLQYYKFSITEHQIQW